MKALLLDPKVSKISRVEFDGDMKSIAALLGHDEIDSETYLPELKKRIRVYRNAKLVDNPRIPGYVIEHTGGAVNHGKCLVVGISRSGKFIDVPDIMISYTFVPGYGVR